MRRSLLALILLATGLVTDAQLASSARAETSTGRDIAREGTCAEESARLHGLLVAEQERLRAGDGDDHTNAELRAQFDAANRTCLNEGLAELRSAQTCEHAEEALTQLLDVARSIQLLGDDATVAAEASAATNEWLVKVAARSYDEAFERCHTEHDPLQAREMLAQLRTLALFGDEGAAEVDPEKVDKCLTFELDFELVMAAVYAPSYDQEERSHVRATGIVLRPALSTEFQPSEGPLKWVSRTSAANACRSRFELHGSTFGVQEFALEIPEDGAPGIRMVINPGRPADDWHLDCGNGHARVISNMGHWWSGFAALHGSEGNVTIGEWSYVGGSLYARKTFNRSGTVGEGIYTETTTLELWHRPRR